MEHVTGFAVGRRNLLDRRITAWVVLAVVLAATFAAYRQAERERERVSRERFLLLAEAARSALADRMSDYMQILRAGAAMFTASEEVDRAHFRVFVRELELDRYLPGIQGTGFTTMVRAAERRAHEEAVRAEGFAEYRIHPTGERDPLSAIVFLEPFDDRNRRAFGYDMYSEPVRREAMDRARDTGAPALSGKVTLVQEYGEETQPGFLVYMPVYRHDAPTRTVEERRAAIEGFVYSPFRAFDLMSAVFEPRATDVELELFDERVAPENLLYDSGIGDRRARHLVTRALPIAGHLWMARFHSSPAFESSRASDEPTSILFGGLALGLLLFAGLYLNARHRQAMRETAGALAQSRDHFRALVENIPGMVFRARIVNGERRIAHLSVGIEVLTGEPRERYIAGELVFDDAIVPEDAPRVREAIAQAVEWRSPYQVEYRVRCASGEVRWVSERGRALYDIRGRPRWLDGVVLDVDDRKRAELAVREMAFHDPLTGLPNRRLLLDRLEHRLAVASREGRLGAVLFLDLDRFKSINDTLGHEVGDKLLVEVSRRLRGALRETDTVARLGGDEFVVLLDEVGEDEDEAVAVARRLARKIASALSEPYQLGQDRCDTTPSIGVALFRGDEAGPEQVLRRADEAMYRAKSAGRNRVSFHDERPRA